MKTRINPETGKEEYWNQPPGLPGIWMTRGFCDRCQPFYTCLGLIDLSDSEWQSVENLMAETNDILGVKKVLEKKDLKTCSGS
jgi:hypothetical protein